MTKDTTPTLRAFHRLTVSACLVALSLPIAATSAMAGDRAQANYLGFSDDGRYFAYEQYGIMDGWGGFYSDIFVIDLAEDGPLHGVPFSTMSNNEDDPRSLADIRATALQAAQPSLDQFGIDNPVAIAALNGDGELGPNGQPRDGSVMHFGQPFYAGIQYDYSLSLEQFDAANSTECPESADGPYRGFALTLTDNEQSTKREVYRDAAQDGLPASRGCALNYAIYSIVYPLESEGDPIALISIYTQGFEGLDRRFTAVPIGGL